MRFFYFLISILAAVIITSCQNKVTQSNEDSTDFVDSSNAQSLKPDSLMQHMYPKIAAETKVAPLIDIISKENQVNERGVGFAGQYTEIYACYERLTQIATDKELLQLLTHTSPAVRVYSYRAIINRNIKLSDNEIYLLKNDTVKVSWFSGCILSEAPVSTFIEEDRKK